MDLKVLLDGKEVYVHYTWQGSGEKTLLTFHGFGQSGEDMRPLGQVLQSEYRTCDIDLFYHGKSYWAESLGHLTKAHWKRIMEVLLEKEDIERFDMAAFSMGGKFLLATLEMMPESVDRIVLMAPDGIRTSTWYSLASYPLLFRRYFRSMIVKPWRFFTLVRVMKKLGLLDKGVAKFAATQMDTRRKRRRVYYSWVMFRRLRFNKQKIARIINQHGIACELYLGEYDKIITAEGMEKLTKHVPDCKIRILESGHNQLIRSTARHLHAKQ